ncbi:MAG: ABC transporter substrate-binding protein [Fimbriimonadaceae bacterium]|nr:ABC transporter substrate-binding protein [Fimbriimonadaceae bacterium]QYK55592.1 MAG: ABC transporter substrate-binding protein [Fimbriimonadaceae bacterium]
MWRTLFATATATFSLLALSGCGTDASAGQSTPMNSQNEGGAPPAPGKKIRIGVSIPNATHGWTAGVIYWVDQAKKAYPDVEWTVVPADKPEKQISDIETLLTKGVDGMVILATESAPLTPVAKKVKEAGVYLVNVDRGFLEPVADVFLEGDNAAFGRKAGEFIGQKLNGQGKIIVLEGMPSTVNTARNGAFREALKAFPGVQILDSQPGEWNRQKSYETLQTLLTKHSQVDAVWAADDDMALGAEQALKEAGRSNVWIVGGGGMKDVVKRVMDNDKVMPATVTYPPSMVATGMFICASALRAGPAQVRPYVPRHLLIDVQLVTPENAKEFYFPDSVY